MLGKSFKMNRIYWSLAVAAALGAPLMVSRAQEQEKIAVDGQALTVEHAECIFFGAKHQKFALTGLKTPAKPDYALSALTTKVTKSLGYASAAAPGPEATPQGTIDKYIFAALKDAGVTPAGATNDYEFIRRVTLDLTGRIPASDRVTSFVADSAADKRARLINELLAKPEYVDKWTMFFGDLYQNTTRNTQVQRYDEGRNAFYKWIHDSVEANKSYDKMATELITAQTSNTYVDGAPNWVVGSFVTGGPQQDIFDQQAADTAQTFLGLANLNCVLCHNGRGHLDTLNLWASKMTRLQAYQLSSFFSHTYLARTKPDPAKNNYYWSVQDDTRYRTDYALNTITGNRPARVPVGTGSTAPPVYPFSGRSPKSGEDYRVALAREVTSDFQFARAAVNYIWKQFFNRGLVEPADQFDLARLDPDNPPPAPWTLQPSNPRLLNALAQDFVDSKYDLKALMRLIANSQAYQLSSRYEGEWKPSYEPLFARKLVRRLWAEEIHDAIAQSSNMIPSYTVGALGKMSWAMQFPEPRNIPGGAVGQFLDNFLRGNRDSDERSGEGSVLESLSLKNDPFVMTRIRAVTTGGVKSLLAQSIGLPDDQLVSALFLTVLSRPATATEKADALRSLQSASNRGQAAEDLLWTLYNKMDFVFNY